MSAQAYLATWTRYRLQLDVVIEAYGGEISADVFWAKVYSKTGATMAGLDNLEEAWTGIKAKYAL
jgi:hypothetical protein